jgi:sugar lactone lactonase YvrE
LALSGSYLYLIDDARTLGRVPIAGGASAPLATRSSDLTSLAADSRNVFWTESESGTVMRAALDGGGATPIVTGLMKPRALAMDAEALYWISDEGTYRHVGKAAKSGGTSTALVPLADAESLTVANGYVYIGGYDELSRVPVGGGTMSPLTTMPGSAMQAVELASDGTYLYFVASNDTLTSSGGRIVGRVAISGGMVALVEDAPLANTFAIDAQHVYFVQPGRMMRRNLDGTNPGPVFDSRSNVVASDIVVDSEWIYFSVERSIYKLRKVAAGS